MKLEDILFDLSAEVTGISMMILGIQNQLDNIEIDSLTPKATREALFGVSKHLDRIADDLNRICEQPAMEGGVTA